MNAAYFISYLVCYWLLQIKKGKDKTGLPNQMLEYSVLKNPLTSVLRSTPNS